MSSLSVSSAAVANPETQPSLVRGLSLLDSVLLLISGIIGSSIFLTAKDIAGSLPHPALFLLVWVLGAAIPAGSMFICAKPMAIYPRFSTAGCYLLWQTADRLPHSRWLRPLILAS